MYVVTIPHNKRIFEGVHHFYNYNLLINGLNLKKAIFSRIVNKAKVR